MVMVGSYVDCIDEVGAVTAQVLSIYGIGGSKDAKMGDLVLVSIKSMNSKKGFFLDEKKEKKLMRGTLHSGMMVYTKKNFLSKDSSFISFSKNGMVLVNKGLFPYANSLSCPIPKEIAMSYPFIGALTKNML